VIGVILIVCQSKEVRIPSQVRKSRLCPGIDVLPSGTLLVARRRLV